jgi:hypothetical protein
MQHTLQVSTKNEQFIILFSLYLGGLGDRVLEVVQKKDDHTMVVGRAAYVINNLLILEH